MTFDIYDEINRVNRAYCEIMGYPTGQRDDIPLAADEIPTSLRKDAERDEDEPDREPPGFDFSEEENQRLDDPRRGQGKWLNRR